MVNSEGQLFTIEGIAAALIMLMTAYLVVNTTSVYTSGDAHINDMQLEVIGSDALKMMNTFPNSTNNKTLLAQIVREDNNYGFGNNFSTVLNGRTGAQPDTIQWMANISFVRPDGTVNSTYLNMSRPLSGGEHAVKVSQWTIIEGRQLDPSMGMVETQRLRAVLVEVFLWRD
jgi:hypothetical protein